MMVYIILILYLAFTFWGSLFGLKDKNKTPESYFLADRSLKTMALFFTILATNFSAFYFLGFAGEGYKIGLIHYVMMSLGTALAALSFFVIGSKVWSLGKKKAYITPAELIYGETHSRPLAMLFSSVMILFTLPYLALQIIGGAYILENLTNGDLSYQLAVILLTIFTIAYVIVGGMTSVAKTDLKQGILLILFMSLAVLVVGHDLGGVMAANAKAGELLPDLFSINGLNDHYSIRKWFSFIVFWFFCIPMFPQLFMRFYIAKDISHLKKSAIMYALIPLFISIMPVLIGIWGHVSFPDLDLSKTDQILPMMLLKHSSDWFAALVMTGAIAAFMSTLDSQLLALSTMITRDFYIAFSQKEQSFERQVLVGRIMVGLLALIGMLIAFNPFDTIFDMGKMAFTGLAILFPVSLAVLRFDLAKPGFAIAGILMSLLLLFAFYYNSIPTSFSCGFEYFIPVIMLSFIICFMGVKRQKDAVIEETTA
jgi:SSS family solute:Na+ symporter